MPAFDNSYARLPEVFYERIRPVPVRRPRLRKLNETLVSDLQLSLDAYSSEQLAQYFSGNELLPGSEPIAQAYAGHQFGGFVPQLGDGRAILIGEVIDRQGQRRDLQLKGSGRTRFSRGGDGRAALGAVIREYILGEAMFHLGIPTTRGLAIVTTGEEVRRETLLPGAILTRVASSHIRVGTFEYFSWRGDHESVKILADHVIDRHYKSLAQVGDKYIRLFAEVVKRQAQLVAQWCEVGFIHGVMNTDNMTVSGETIDYGPCAFIDEYEPGKVFSSIDRQSRYSFENQPRAALWNLSMLAHCLRPLFSQDERESEAAANAVLASFETEFQANLLKNVKKKLGLSLELPGDETLVKDFFALMEQARADYSLSFRSLSKVLLDASKAQTLQEYFGKSLEPWLLRWTSRCHSESRSLSDISVGMLMANPAYIARNHLVEAAIKSAVDDGNWTKTDRLLDAVSLPFEERVALQDQMLAPRPEERVTQTFCGT